MAIVKDPKTGKYKFVKSPPSYYQPKTGGGSRTVPSDFVGPLRPGTTREPAPPIYSGPVRPGTDEKTFRTTGQTTSSGGGSRTVPSDFVGPLRPGTTREPAVAPPKIAAPISQMSTGKTTEQVKKDITFGKVTPGIIQTDKRVVKGTYSPAMGLYTTPTYGVGVGGTATFRSPTLEEKEKIESAKFRGSIPGIIGEAKKGVKWYEKEIIKPLSEAEYFKKYQEKIVEPTSKGLQAYKEKVVDPTSEALQWYKKEVVVPTSKHIVEPTKKTFGTGVSKYKEKIVVPLREIVPSLGETQIGQIAQAKRIVEKKKSGEKVRVGLPGQIREVDVDKFKGTGIFGFGKKVYLGEVETAFTDIGATKDFSKRWFSLKPETFGKTVRYTSEFAPYAIPGVFVGETGVGLSEASLGGKFGGPTSAAGYVKKHPFEIAFAGAVGLGAGVKMIKGAPLKKLAAFAGAPISKTVTLKPETKILKEFQKVYATSKEIRGEEAATFLKFSAKQKGGAEILLEAPTGAFKGELRETIKPGLFKKPKEYRGVVELSKKGEYTETLDIGKDLRRITKFEKKGPGKVGLWRGDKLLISKEIERPVIPKVKVKKQVKKDDIDKVLGSTGTITEKRGFTRDIITGKPIREVKKEISEGGTKLETTLISGKRKGAYQYGIDPRTGFSQKIKQVETLLDISKVGPKRGVVFAESSGGKAVMKKMVGQKLEFGMGGEMDIKVFGKVGERKLLGKIETPKIQRKISQRIEQEITFGYTDPRLLRKLTPKAKKLKIKQLKKIRKKEAVKIKAFELEKNIRGLTRDTEIASTKRTLLLKKKKQNIYDMLDDIKTTTKIQPTRELVGTIRFQTPRIPFLSRLSRQNTGRVSLLGLASQSSEIFKSARATQQADEQKNITDQLQAQATVTEQAQINKTIVRTIEKTKSAEEVLSRSTTSRSPPALITRPPVPVTKQGFGIGFKFPSLALPPASRGQQGYLPQAKTKGGKWITLSKEPMTRSAALSRASRATDSTLSAQFRIRKSKGTPSSSPDNYFGVTQRKYRPYKIKKGKKLRLHDQFIEKRGSRIDTHGEKKGLKLAKFVKQQGWLAQTKKKKKTKSQWLI